MEDNKYMVKCLAEQLSAEKNRDGYTKKIYKAASDAHKGEEISRSIADKKAIIKASLKFPRVDLSNFEQVQERTFIYLDACEQAQCFPSVMGLSTAFGHTRQSINQWLRNHHGHRSAEFIELVKDNFADILTNASLYNNANPIATIFQLKNNHAFADRIDIAPVAPTPLGEKQDINEIAKRYGACIPDDDE